MVSGNAVAMPWASDVEGILPAWYLGSETGNIIADIVSGDVNPSGKLPFTFPKNLKDNAAHSFDKMSYPGDGDKQIYKEGILVGYRWHDTKRIEPLFAFGHGLSYAIFEMKNVSADKKQYHKDELITIKGVVENTGNIEGAEVIQVYVGKNDSKVERAVKELKGYLKLHIAMGVSQEFEIKINIKELAYYDEEMSDWNIENGRYTVYVGNSSDNIIKEIDINVK